MFSLEVNELLHNNQQPFKFSKHFYDFKNLLCQFRSMMPSLTSKLSTFL
jgi:hypothetical protein